MTRGETLGERLRRLRQEKGLSQDRLSKIADIGPGTIFLMEKGVRKRFQDYTLEKVAAALGVTPSYLEHGWDAPPSEEHWPAVDVVLRHTSELTEDDIQAVRNYVEFLEFRQRQEFEAKQKQGEDVEDARGGKRRRA